MVYEHIKQHHGVVVEVKNKEVAELGRKIPINDLKHDPFVRFQKQVDPYWNLFWCFVFPTMFTYYVLGDSFENGLLVPGFLRYCFVLHCTWSVNSTVHKFGERPYAENNVPTENALVSFLALGEGWHSWHHTHFFFTRIHSF